MSTYPGEHAPDSHRVPTLTSCMFSHDISGIKRSCFAGPQRCTLYIRHTFEQRDQFLVFAGDPDEAGGERAGAGDFVCLGSEPAGADGPKVSDVRLAANRP